MARQSSPNYAGLRTALVLGSVAASVLGGRLVTARDAAAQAAKQAQEPDPALETELPVEATATIPPTPMPTPTPRIIIIYDLPAVPTAITLGGQPAAVPAAQGAQIVPALPQPPVIADAGGGGGGGGGGGKGGGGGGGGNPAPKPKPAKKSKSS